MAATRVITRATMKGNLKVTKRMLAARAYACARTSKSLHKAQTEPRRGVVSLNPERNLKPNPNVKSRRDRTLVMSTKMRPKEREGGGTVA